MQMNSCNGHIFANVPHILCECAKTHCFKCKNAKIDGSEFKCISLKNMHSGFMQMEEMPLQDIDDD